MIILKILKKLRVWLNDKSIFYLDSIPEKILLEAEKSLKEDLQKILKVDPSHKYIPEIYYECPTPFMSVAVYRLSHLIWQNGDFSVALDLSHAARVVTLVEIHPAAEIGKCLVIEHGTGTVIGQSTVIGDDCCIMNGVILGSRKASANEDKPRHPIIGDNTWISAGSAILGLVYVGNNVRISPYSLVTEDIPDNTIYTFKKNENADIKY